MEKINESMKSMVIEMSILLLSHKLRTLLRYKGIFYSRTKASLKEAIDQLGSTLRRIRDIEQCQIGSKFTALCQELDMGSLNNLENIIDTFIVKTELQQQGCLVKIMSPIILLTSQQDQTHLTNMMKAITAHVKASLLIEEDHLVSTCTTSSHPLLTQSRNLDDLMPDELDFVGLEDKVDELLKQLFQEKCQESDNVITVIGVAGSGKTALTKTVYNTKYVVRAFDHRAWVNVSEDFEARDFLVNILTQLGWQVEDLPDYELQLGLKSFSMESRCLIVVDDVRTHHDLEKLSIVLKFIGGRSRLILTTRSQDLAHVANRWRNPIRQRRLTDEEIWTLFLKKLPIAEDNLNNSVLINLQKNILSVCDGLPQAILILGGLLSTRHLSNWPSVIEQIDQIDLADQENILILSYQDLPFRMKFCFIYFGLFPRAFEIPIRRLFHLWLAEGLVIPLPDEHIAPEDLAEDYFKQLISRNLIEVAEVRLDGSPKTCRMPAIIWDVFYPVAVDLGIFFTHNNTSKGNHISNIRRLAEYAGIKNYSSSDPCIQHLRSYVSFNTRKRDLPTQEIGMFLKNVVTKRGFGLLIVLDLEKVYKPMIPETVGKLLHLKYLGFRWTFLDSLPMFVGNLPYLETLDVKHTNIIDLPSSIWNAKNLRHLYLNESHFDLSIKRLDGGSLTNLQTLSGLLICNAKFVSNCLNKLNCLRKLKLTYNLKSVKEVADWISQLRDLRSLKLRSMNEFGQPLSLELQTMADHKKLTDLYLLGQLPRFIDKHQFPPNLKILTLSASRLGEDPMPILGQLHHLKILRLLGYSYLGKQMTCLPKGFPELRVLKLWMLDNMEEWIVKNGAMPRLRELEIRQCVGLNLPKELQFMTSLKEIILTNMPEQFVAKVKRVMVYAIVKEITWPVVPLR